MMKFILATIVAVLLVSQLVASQPGHHMAGHAAHGGGSGGPGYIENKNTNEAPSGAKQSHIPHQHSLTLVMQRGDPERCFYIVSRVAEDRMFFEYRVRTGRPLFDIVIRHPGGGIVYQSLSGEYEETEGNKIFFIANQIGEYSMCVSGASQEIVVTLNAAMASKKRAMTKRDPVLKAVAVMKATVEGLLQDQDYLRSRERSHRDTLETHNSQVFWRFVVELTALLAMSVGQVFFLRKLFDKKSSRAA